LDVLGYYYLNLTSYQIGKIDEKSDGKFARVAAIPAVYLGMIGVHSGFQKSGIGKKLMHDAMLRTIQIADNAGTYGLTLDALDENLVEYYSQFGFQVFRDPDKEKDGIEMYLPLKTIQSAIASWQTAASGTPTPADQGIISEIAS
jgi:GNAT superfamily N-acetyltransferase